MPAAFSDEAKLGTIPDDRASYALSTLSFCCAVTGAQSKTEAQRSIIVASIVAVLFFETETMRPATSRQRPSIDKTSCVKRPGPIFIGHRPGGTLGASGSPGSAACLRWRPASANSQRTGLRLPNDRTTWHELAPTTEPVRAWRIARCSIRPFKLRCWETTATSG